MSKVPATDATKAKSGLVSSPSRRGGIGKFTPPKNALAAIINLGEKTLIVGCDSRPTPPA